MSNKVKQILRSFRLIELGFHVEKEHHECYYFIYNTLNSLVKSDKNIENEFCNNLLIYVTPDKHFMIYQDEKNKDFWCSYDNFWSFFESKYSLEYTEIQGLLNDILNKHFKKEGYTTDESWKYQAIETKQTLKG